MFVSHDAEDDGWQFLDGTPPKMEDALIVSLYSIVQRDPSVASLADLPSGWQAERISANAAWKRAQG